MSDGTRSTRHRNVKRILTDDTSVYKCSVCDKTDAGASHKIDNAADRHARVYGHSVTIWRTTFTTLRFTPGEK